MISWIDLRGRALDARSLREVLPRAGALRVRLDAGCDARAFVERVIADGRAAGFVLEGDAQATPELEDVFVSVLEQAQGAP